MNGEKMKVRPPERDVYNFIQKRKVVTFIELTNKFGKGDSVLISRFLPRYGTAFGLSRKLWDALYELREKGSIFEIACGLELHQLLHQVKPSTDIEIAHFKYPKKYGYSGLKWLPCVFCSKKGVVEIYDIYCQDFKEYDKSHYSRNLTKINKMLNGNINDKLMLMIYISDILDGRFADIWKIKLERLKTIHRLNKKV